MNDDIAGVDQHPVTLGQALSADGSKTALLQALDEMFGDRYNMPMGAAAGDDHGIGDGCLADEVDDGHVLSLVFLERAGGKQADCFGTQGLASFTYVTLLFLISPSLQVPACRIAVAERGSREPPMNAHAGAGAPTRLAAFLAGLRNLANRFAAGDLNALRE